MQEEKEGELGKDEGRRERKRWRERSEEGKMEEAKYRMEEIGKEKKKVEDAGRRGRKPMKDEGRTGKKRREESR